MTDTPRILCIEDDTRLRRLLEEDLSDAGYDVVVAADAVSGIEAFFHHAPALVLCDIRMPVISGFDFFERLRQLDAQGFGAAFIFLTALADRDNELRGRRLGADDYITKPVDYEILHEVIRVRLSGRPPRGRPPELPRQLGARLLDWFRNPSGPAPAGLADELHGHLGIKRAAAEPAPVPSGQASGVLLDDMSIGILIIDADGRYNYVNETAARVLGRPRAALIGMRAAAPLAAFARRHRAEAAQTGVTVTAERLAFGGDRASVVAIARPADAARVAIVLPVLLSARPAFSELLAKLFDLTHAERSLASELSGGANLTEIADLRGVSIATVRTQVRAVYSKIGVSGQNDLARTLTMLHAAIGAAPG